MSSGYDNNKQLGKIQVIWVLEGHGQGFEYDPVCQENDGKNFMLERDML